MNEQRELSTKSAPLHSVLGVLVQSYKFLVIICSLLAGTAAGIAIAFVIKNNRENDLSKQKVALGHSILEGTGKISIGDSLPDHVFLALNGSRISLSNLCQDVTVLTLIDPSCEQCLEELVALPDETKGLLPEDNFLVIAASNPVEMSKIREETKFGAVYLYDFRGEWITGNRLSVFPCNLFVNRNLRLAYVVAGKLTRHSSLLDNKKPSCEGFLFNRKTELMNYFSNTIFLVALKLPATRR